MALPTLGCRCTHGGCRRAATPLATECRSRSTWTTVTTCRYRRCERISAYQSKGLRCDGFAPGERSPMNLGFVSAVLPELSLDALLAFAAENRPRFLSVWPVRL